MDEEFENEALDFTILERRADGSFVVERFGMPYHVPRGWPEWEAIAAKASGEAP